MQVDRLEWTEQPVRSVDMTPVGDERVDPETGTDLQDQDLQQNSERGQGLVEYALVLLLIAIVLIFMLTFIGAKLNSTFSKIGSGFGP
jgi:pilus assembly protein Flp/PilA